MIRNLVNKYALFPEALVIYDRAVPTTILGALVSFMSTVAYTSVMEDASIHYTQGTTISDDDEGISGSITINGIDYKWMETSWSKNRGMTFNPGKHIYQFSPNPHDDPLYNKNQVYLITKKL